MIVSISWFVDRGKLNRDANDTRKAKERLILESKEREKIHEIEIKALEAQDIVSKKEIDSLLRANLKTDTIIITINENLRQTESHLDTVHVDGLIDFFSTEVPDSTDRR